MKKIFLTTALAIIFIITAMGQAPPQKFNYQTVVRDIAGVIIPNTLVAFKFVIREGTPSGPYRYKEEHFVTTDDFGSITLEIGDGAVYFGSWDDILWRDHRYYLVVRLDITGSGSSYTTMGTSQLISVPYALYAEEDGDWVIDGPDIYYNKGKVGIGTDSPAALLDVGGNFNISDDGIINHNYVGSINALNAIGSSPTTMYHIENNDASNGCALVASMSNTLANATSCGVNGINYGSGFGTYGRSYNSNGIGIRGKNFVSGNFGDLGGTSAGVYGQHGVSNNEGILGTSFYGVFGHNPTSDNEGMLASTLYGAYGVFAASGNAGYLGTNDYGVYGLNFISNNTGYLGTEAEGVHGIHGTSNHSGSLGTNNYGVYGHHSVTTNYGYIGDVYCGVGGHIADIVPGKYGVHGYGPASGPLPSGIDNSLSGTIGGVVGHNEVDEKHYYGVAGYTAHDATYTGGVLGSDIDGLTWGCLGYMDAGFIPYAGYFEGDMKVNGNLYVTTLPFGDMKDVQWDNTTGQFYYDNSSMRYKENINSLEDDYSKLLAVSPKSYTRPNNPGVQEIGYIAEEFDAAGLNKLVWYDKDGKPEGINYDKIILYTNENMKNQNERIIALEEEIRQLKETIETLQEKH